MSIIHFSKEDSLDNLIKEGVCVVDFFATWCGPCSMLAPTLESVDAKLGSKIKIIKIDADDNQTVCGKYGIQFLPTVFIFSNGKIIDKFVGLKSKDEIISMINKVL